MAQAFGSSTILSRLAQHARDRPHKPFVSLYRGEQFQVVAYADLQVRAERWAARYLEMSPAPGATVFLILRHGVEVYPAVLGAMLAGLVPAVLAPPSPKQEPAAFWSAQRALFARTRPAAAVIGRQDLEAMTEEAGPLGCPFIVAEDTATFGDLAVHADPPPEAPALLQHSSGTTGLKKAVRLSFAQVDRHAGMLAEGLDFTADDVVASWLPLYHDMGLMAAFLLPLTLGASVVAIDPFAWVADPSSLLRAVTRHRATLCWMPNFAFAHLARTRDPEARHDLSSVRAFIDCSEPCRPETIETFCDAFGDEGAAADRIACSYGMAEVVFAATQTQIGAPPQVLEVDAEALERHGEIVRGDGGRVHQFLSCGRPLPGVELRIAASAKSHDGERRAAGSIQVGEIEVASPVLFDGYHHGEAEPVDPPQDGWRATGDIGFLHDGALYVCGRTMERLIVHGRNVYAGDVEAVASQVPGVKAGRAVALGVMDEAIGAEEAWLMLEGERPLTDPAERGFLIKAVRRAVQDALDLTLGGVEIGPPGWLAKSTSGKMSRSENLQKLNRLIAQAPRDEHDHGRPRPLTALEPKGPPTAVEMEVQAETQAPPIPSTAAPLAASPHAQSAKAAVKQALAECFGRDGARLSDKDGFGDVGGWDSLGHTIVILRIEALLGVKAPEATAVRARTVGGLIEAFGALAAAAAVEAAPSIERHAA